MVSSKSKVVKTESMLKESYQGREQEALEP